MIRLFDIRDVATVQRLSPFGRPLAYESVAVDGLSPLREAMRAYVAAGYDHAITLVYRHTESRDLDAFGLMRIISAKGQNISDAKQAALVTMAPGPQSEHHQNVWSELAEAFIIQAGDHGVNSIVAETPVNGHEMEALARVGFSPLIHQDILKLSVIPSRMNAPEVHGLARQQSSDEAYVRLLSMRVVPRFLFKGDGMGDLTRLTHHAHCGFILLRQQEPLAHISMQQGRRGIGMQVLFRHDAEDLAEPVLKYVLSNLCDETRRPVYCMLPSYQSWLLPVLDQLGFIHVTSNMIMVKHTTARIRQPVWSVQPGQSHSKLAKGDTKIHHRVPPNLP